MSSMITGSMFARLVGVSRQRVSDLALDGKLERSRSGRFNLDAPLNRAFLDSHVVEEDPPESPQEESAYFEWFVKRLIRGAFQEARGVAALLVDDADFLSLPRDLARVAGKAKTPKAASAAVEQILRKAIGRLEPFYAETEDLYLTFSSEDDSKLRHELDMILWEDEDGRSLDDDTGAKHASESETDYETEEGESKTAVGASPGIRGDARK